MFNSAVKYFRAVCDAKTRMPSLRLWSFRNGVEDFEYLQILKWLTDRLEERGPGKKWLAQEARMLLDVRIAGADWLKAGAGEIMKHRARVVDMIERIQKELKDRQALHYRGDSVQLIVMHPYLLGFASNPIVRG